jgi:hypothetical protein
LHKALEQLEDVGHSEGAGVTVDIDAEWGRDESDSREREGATVGSIAVGKGTCCCGTSDTDGIAVVGDTYVAGRITGK